MTSLGLRRNPSSIHYADFADGESNPGQTRERQYPSLNYTLRRISTAAGMPVVVQGVMMLTAWFKSLLFESADHRPQSQSVAVSMTIEEMVRGLLPKNTVIDFRLENESIRLETITDGILFVMASWSGSSLASLRTLSLALVTADPNATIKVTVVDTDDCIDIVNHPDFVGKLGGYGETVWYKGGKPVGFASHRKDVDLYVANTKTLLN